MPAHYYLPPYLPPLDYPDALPWNTTNAQAQAIIPAADLLNHWRGAPEWWRVWMLGQYAPDLASAVRALRVLCLAVDDCPTDREDERTAAQEAAIRAVEHWLFGGPLPNAAAAAAGSDRHAWEVAEVAAGRDPRTAYGSLLATLLASAARFQTVTAPSIDTALRRTIAGPVFRRMVCRGICHKVAKILRNTHARDLAPPDWPPSRLLDGDRPYDLPDPI